MCDGRKLANGFGRVVAMAAALLTLLFGGCVRNEFDVEVSLPEKVSGHYSFLYYASDPAKGWFAEEMMMVEKGKGAVTGRTRNPSLVWIMDGRPAALFYAERGDRIRITGDSENPASWRVKGNDVTGRIDGWRHSNRAALSSMDARKVNAAVSGYVRENPSDPVSAILMAVYYDRRADEAGFAATWKMLRDDALEKEWVDLVSRSDISTGGPWMRNAAGGGAEQRWERCGHTSFRLEACVALFLPCRFRGATRGRGGTEALMQKIPRFGVENYCRGQFRNRLDDQDMACPYRFAAGCREGMDAARSCR